MHQAHQPASSSASSSSNAAWCSVSSPIPVSSLSCAIEPPWQHVHLWRPIPFVTLPIYLSSLSGRSWRPGISCNSSMSSVTSMSISIDKRAVWIALWSSHCRKVWRSTVCCRPSKLMSDQLAGTPTCYSSPWWMCWGMGGQGWIWCDQGWYRFDECHQLLTDRLWPATTACRWLDTSKTDFWTMYLEIQYTIVLRRFMNEVRNTIRQNLVDELACTSRLYFSTHTLL